jgi:glutaredoxin
MSSPGSAPNTKGWQDIQQNTFTRWCNSHLKKRGYHINDLGKDLKDGIMLINLLEIISGKSLGKWSRNPRVPHQKMENCAIAIDFVKSEGLKLVNISGDDINNCRLKLILGLIWTLILRYHIHSSGDDNELLKWVQSKIPEHNIKNFTSDWNDGRAICGLVDALSPGLCPKSLQMDKSAWLDNATKGITTADTKMGIAQLILPNEMTNPKVDDHAMQTYIQQYRDWKDNKVTDASQCSAYGPGLVQGVVNELSNFTVATPGRGKLEVKVVGPASTAKVNIKNNGDGSYAVSYTPTEPGTYKIHVTLDGVHIPGSIFTVIVLDQISLGGEGKVRVFFSSTSSSEKGRQDFFDLEKLMTEKKIHLRPDFEPWVAVDILEREDREAVFKRAGARTLPIVFIDDQYMGDYDSMLALSKSGKLDQLLNTMKHKYDEEKEGNFQKMPSKNFEAKTATNTPAGKGTSSSGPVKSSSGAGGPKFCSACGAKQTVPGAAKCGACGVTL